MNAKFLIPLIAGTIFTLSAHAHNCSGGTNGGMDATGNQCNDAATAETDVSSAGAMPQSAPLPKAKKDEARFSNSSAAKHTVVTRHAAVRHQIRRS